MQVIDMIKKDMVAGRLQPGEKLPSTRELAVQYHINPNTAGRIYREMEMQNMCFTKRGLGTFVTEDEKIFSGIREQMAEEVVLNFVKEMKELGFSSEEVISDISKRYGE
jgi:DNA-binding transcriptional regulator YhcF (GntR family)